MTTSPRPRSAVIRPVLLVVTVGAALLGGCRGEEQRGLVVEAPSALRQAVTSTDEALCSQLAVDLTVREVTAAGAEIDHAPLSASGLCQWSLDDDEVLLNRGTYRILARFTVAGAYPGRADCLALGADPLWVGAYWVEEVAFPFPADFGGLTEDLFISRPDDDVTLSSIQSLIGDNGVSFDLDTDGFDNLVEIAGASNPCVPNQPPQVDLDVTPTAVMEGDPVTVTVETDEPGGLQHDVVVRFAHAHGAQVAPQQADVILRPHDAENITVASPLPGQTWSIDVTVVDAVPESDTSGRWSMTFVPDEPFVGDVTVSAFARQQGGGPAFDGAPTPVVIDVENVLDPVRIVAEDPGGALVPVTTLDFAEAGSSAGSTTLRLKAESQDLGAQVAGTLTLVSGPDGMVAGSDVGFLTLAWSPDNAAAATPPEGGHEAVLRFEADNGEDSDTTLPVRVTPTFNDPPLLGELAAVNTNLSPEPYDFKRLRFDVIDPDRFADGIDDVPTCTVDVWPAGDPGCSTACCADAFTSVTCAPDGTLDEDTWHMVATLTPGPGYFTSCGAEPSFVARLSVTDLAPPDAEPLEDKTVTTVPACGSADDCWEDLTLTTAGLAQAVVTGGWDGTLGGNINGTTGALIDPVTQTALMGVYLSGGAVSGAQVAMVDLSGNPTVARVYDGTAELGRIGDFLNYLPAGVVDTVNHRAVFYGRTDGDAVVASVQMQAPYDVTTWPVADFCGGSCTGSECGAAPAVDPEGTVWVPCGRNGDGTLARLDAAGSVTQHDMGAEIDSGSGTPGATVILDDDGDPWLLWPGQTGVAAIDLATYDAVTPTVQRAADPPLWSELRMEGYATRQDLSEAYFAYNQANAGDGMAEIIRVRVESDVASSTTPLVFGPTSVTNNGSLFHRIVLREPAAGALPDEPELLITGGDNQDERPMIDLDTWTLLSFPRPASDYLAYSSLRELYASPLPDYFVGVVNDTAFKGLVLFPWDPDQSPIELDLGVPSTGDIKQTWITSSPAAGKLLVQKSGELVVIDFAGGG